MTILSRLMNFFGVLEEENLENDYEGINKSKHNIVSLHTQKNIKLVLFEPRTFDETQEIADNLKSHRPVLVNLQRIRKDIGLRIVDFLSGTVYALGGNIQKVGANIFVCTPANVDIQGNITEFMQDET